MVSKIIKNVNGVYVCSYCRMRVDPDKTNCPFCGNYFSNQEIIMTEKFEEETKNESSLHSRDRESYRI